MKDPKYKLGLTGKRRGKLDQINMKTGTSEESKLPDTVHVQAENTRLLGRAVKAAAKLQIKDPLHL